MLGPPSGCRWGVSQTPVGTTFLPRPRMVTLPGFVSPQILEALCLAGVWDCSSATRPPSIVQQWLRPREGRAEGTPTTRARPPPRMDLELPVTTSGEKCLLGPSHFRGETIDAQRGKLTPQGHTAIILVELGRVAWHPGGGGETSLTGPHWARQASSRASNWLEASPPPHTLHTTAELLLGRFPGASAHSLTPA